MLGLLAALSAQSTKATTYTLGYGNTGINGVAGPYATVTVNLTDSTHANILFSALDSGAYHFLFGDGGSVGLNVNGTYSVSALTGTGQLQSPNSPFTPTLTGNQNEDGWGKFNLNVDNFDGFQYAVRTVSFTLTDTSGSWTDSAHVLAANAAGYVAAAHIFIANGPTYSNTGLTGYAANSGTGGSGEPQPTPDGGVTISLLGSAMMGLALLRRKLAKS